MSSVRRYQPALDGVRALAIAGVVAQHLHLAHAPAGALGVDVFFVLSGYLITGLLVAERETTGTVNLRAFYLRRALRLYPALLAVLVIGGSLVVLDLDAPARPVVIGGLLAAAYLTDLATFTHTTAWAAWGFTWSLAIEEHFYLLWPAGLRRMLRGRVDPRAVALCSAVVALVIGEVTARAGHGGPATAYFQPQTHAFGLLVGCALALSRPGGWARWLTAPCLAGLVLLMTLGPSAASASFIRVGVPVACLFTVGLLAGLEHRSPAERLLGIAPLRRLGVISYGLYLYHLVVFAVVAHHLHAQHDVLMVVEVAAAVAVADLSYRFYEAPLRARGRRRAEPAAAPTAGSSEPAPTTA